MKQLNVRKLLKIMLLVIIVVAVVNGLRVYFFADQPIDVRFDAVNKIASSVDRAQGNYVLYSEDNGIKTFPIMWGGRLFLYDVTKNKGYPIKLSAGYNREFGNDLSLRGNYVYYSRSWYTGDGGPTEMLNLRKDKNADFSGISSQENYFLTDKYLYGINDALGVFRASVDTKETKYIFKGEGYFYVDILEDSLFAYNEKGNIVMEKSLTGGSAKKYAIPKKHYVLKIIQDTPDYFTYINCEGGTIEKYSKNNGETKTITKFQKGLKYGEYYSCDTFKIKGDYLYCNDVDLRILKINLKNGKITKLIDQSKTICDVESCSISYCTDYIVVDTIKAALVRTKTLSVYDYLGNLIRTKHLTAHD